MSNEISGGEGALWGEGPRQTHSQEGEPLSGSGSADKDFETDRERHIENLISCLQLLNFTGSS